MIFDKKVYSPSQFFLSFLKRVRLVSFMRSNQRLTYSEDLRRAPYSSRRLSSDDLIVLNDSCHVEAFSQENSEISINMSICNSCGDCAKLKDKGIEMKEILSKEYSVMNLLLHRDA